MVSLVALIILFASSSHAVELDIQESKRLINDFLLCQDRVVILSDIIDTEKKVSINLSSQIEKVAANYTIVETEAAEWKAEYLQCTVELIDAKKTPWWKFNLKSVFTGSILTLIVIIAI